jgi:hypothetical protein
MHIKAGFLSGYPIRCSICLETKEAGRVYDVDSVTLFDPMTASPARSGSVSICQSCRDEFHAADNELDADQMYEWSMQQEAERRRQIEERVAEGGVEWNPPAKHMTFKVRD